jgi:hypothetical protein
MLVTHALYGLLMLYGVSNFLVYELCICVLLMYVCMHQCMDYVLDNLWYSNYKNLYVLVLYGLFHPFSSMLSIVHVQSTYNVNKSVTTICMIFVYFSIYFLALQAPKPMASVLLKTGPINRQSRSIYWNSVQFIDTI